MPLTQNILLKYINPIFIETGTYNGHCSFMAKDLGFEVYTIEYDNKKYDICKKRFSNNKKIHLYLGSSDVLLPKILKEINQPVTIWLDAHPPDDPLTVNNCPIIKELETILLESKRLKFKILIDDMRIFDSVAMKNILDLANKIGTISYEESKCGPKDIMVIT